MDAGPVTAQDMIGLEPEERPRGKKAEERMNR
jgi:hypothetical protein